MSRGTQNPKCYIINFNLLGAEGGSRTHMKLPSRDFESRASAIPPLRHIFVCRDIAFIKFLLLNFFVFVFLSLPFLSCLASYSAEQGNCVGSNFGISGQNLQ